jgi:tripartite-type tricarboxylate transporter receptor subunit TctC
MLKPAVSVLLVSAVLASIQANAQVYPSKPIRMIVPYAGGSGPDIAARSLAIELVKQLGQQVVVDNRPGGSGIIGFEMIARSVPDGYTVGYIGTNFVTNPGLFKTLPYDTIRDFQPVIHATSNASLLGITPSLPVRSINELIELARAKPGTLTYGSGGNGSSPHLDMELFKSMTGTNLLHVAYKGTQQSLSDVIGGQIHLVCNPLVSILPQVTAGKIRALGVTSLKRAPAAPDVPTFDESGVTGYESIGWGGYVFPARVSRDIVLKLNAEINKAQASPTLSKAIVDRGSIAAGGTPEQLASRIRNETERYGKLIKALGIPLQ